MLRYVWQLLVVPPAKQLLRPHRRVLGKAKSMGTATRRAHPRKQGLACERTHGSDSGVKEFSGAIQADDITLIVARCH
jgi:hypothetical protein